MLGYIAPLRYTGKMEHQIRVKIPMRGTMDPHQMLWDMVIKIQELKALGYNVSDSSLFDIHVIFETQEEAALFKLTHMWD